MARGLRCKIAMRPSSTNGRGGLWPYSDCAEAVMKVRGLCDGTLTQRKERSIGYLWEIGPGPQGALAGDAQKHGGGGFHGISVVVWAAAGWREAVCGVESECSLVGFTNLEKNGLELLQATFGESRVE